MSAPIRALAFLPILVVTAALHGCVAGGVNTTVAKDAPLTADKGLVVVSVVTNRRSLPYSFPNWYGANLASTIDTKLTGTLSRVRCGDFYVGTCTYVGNLPAGQYYITSFSSYFSGGDVSYWITAPIGPGFGTFEVKAGQVTDLGTLVIHPETPQMARFVAGQVPTDERLREWLKADYAAVLPADAFAKPLGWSRSLDMRNEFAATASRFPTTSSDPQRLADGRILVPTKLGGVLERSTAGEWKLHKLDTALTTEDMAIFPRGGLRVLLEGGMMLEADSAAGPWRPSRLLGVPGNPERLAYQPSGAPVVASYEEWTEVDAKAKQKTKKKRKGYRVYVGQPDGSWTKLVEVAVKDSDPKPQLVRIGDRWAFADPGIVSSALVLVRPATGEVVRNEKFKYSKVYGADDGTLFAWDPPFLAGNGTYYISRDAGTSWTKLPRGEEGKPLDIAKMPRVVGGKIVTLGDRPFAPKSKDKEIGWFETSDFGATWTPWALTPDTKLPCLDGSDLVENGADLLLVCHEGSAYRFDRSKSEWIVERKAR